MDPALASASEGLAGAFVDSLWLEEGLSRNTLDAYRRDLVLLGQWLAGRGKTLPETQEADLNAYFSERHAQTRATTANRRLTVFKRYFRWALRERLVQSDPTLRMLAAKQALRVPKTLGEAQVDALLSAPDVATELERWVASGQRRALARNAARQEGRKATASSSPCRPLSMR